MPIGIGLALTAADAAGTTAGVGALGAGAAGAAGGSSILPWLLGGSSLLGAGASIFGAGAQSKAEQEAIQAQLQMFGIAQGDLQPFINSGQQSLGWYNYLTGTGGNPNGGGTQYNPLTAPLTAPFTAATLPSTPGYQFTLNQGLKDTQNSYAAQGLGSSGAAEKGAAAYATGQAQSTYNQQLQNYLTQNQQIANLLYQPAALGENAAGSLAGAAVGTGSGVASSTAGIGNALAGGAAGVSNSLSGGVNSALQYTLLQQLLAAKNPASTVNNAVGNNNPFQIG
jgi:hypothetical protein